MTMTSSVMAAGHGEVVRDEEIGDAQPLVEIGEEIEDLGTDRDVERRYRLNRQ